MFKIIFRFMLLTVFLAFLTVGLAMWKGGEPFRYFGEGVIVVGESIREFGDFVDDFIEGGNELRENYDRIKDVITEGKKG